MAKAAGSFELASWDEETYEDLDDGGKLTRLEISEIKLLSRKPAAKKPAAKKPAATKEKEAEDGS